MIWDRAEKLDLRKVPKEARPLPEVIPFEGERIVTTWTETNFGGRRQWFLCPTCDRRCRILYRIADGPLWGCRACLDGRYASEHKSRGDRKLQKAFNLRERLGQCSGGLDVPFPERPKGMHHRTYARLRLQGLKLEEELWLDALKSLGQRKDPPG
jgi:ribosomal protein L37AE/L43A